MANNLAAYQASNAIAITLAGLASSGTVTAMGLAGWQSAIIDNTSGLWLDRPISGFISTGTTPTVGSQIEGWVIPMIADGVWPDVFGAGNAAATVTSRGNLESYAKLLFSIQMDLATSNVKWNFYNSVAALFGALVPKKYQLYVVHNTQVALNATGGNHSVNETPDNVTTA